MCLDLPQQSATEAELVHSQKSGLDKLQPFSSYNVYAVFLVEIFYIVHI